MPALLLTCEHASCALPPGFDPGVGPEVVASHLGWDPGALEVAQVVAARTGAPLLAGEWSRLFVDLNRSPDLPGAVPAESCGVPIPGNQALPPEERARRLAAVQAPYRAAVRAAVERAVVEAGACLHVSVHSFTPELHGRPRPYDAGVLFDPDRPLEVAAADALLAGLRAAGRPARPNEPYAGTDDGLTTWLRTCFAPDRYAGIEVELNQALLARPGAPAAVGEALAALLAGLA
ncbi:MAG: N-formylglutamate amidohydrolase [Planctomycetes bacterium]|nr:N-formylglutamate amidohydrolase [Planctomycetota bacterium]